MERRSNEYGAFAYETFWLRVRFYYPTMQTCISKPRRQVWQTSNSSNRFKLGSVVQNNGICSS
jgi:hypothetical protein